MILNTFRCGIYPAHILYSTLYDAAGFIEFFSAYYIFNGLLVTLQVLHCVWTYFLIKVINCVSNVVKMCVSNSLNSIQAVHKAVVVGGIDDKRSDSEDDNSEDENYNQKVKKDA